ncbi:MAG: M48 family peptidase [Candidatus Staskawiczbacteria bacterium]|nr:M48 family peptidase [Candidatus Staskawiczbacteria bacterium]
MKRNRKEFLYYKERARLLVQNRIAHYNKIYHFKFNRIAIRNQRSRWGSCSKKGNLNFNYKIMLLPEKMADYVILHELCHLGEFNHSKNFWKLMAMRMPDYAKIKKQFKKIVLKRI